MNTTQFAHMRVIFKNLLENILNHNLRKTIQTRCQEAHYKHIRSLEEYGKTLVEKNETKVLPSTVLMFNKMFHHSFLAFTHLARTSDTPLNHHNTPTLATRRF